MAQFEIQDQFLMDGKPFKILSGAIHYFRVHPKDWYHSLYNLKALGFNTVETYVAWNLHEPHKGEFCFEGGLDIERFLTLAKELGLYAIVRPSPYICAEWEFGGIPAWLLNEPDIRIRSSDAGYLQHVAAYYDVLIPKLLPFELHQGGNVLMFQVENEYGSYGEDKEYLRRMKQLMLERGITMPLFTSDGPWRATLRAGSLIEDDVLVTGNFGSRATEKFADMQKFFDEYGKTWPLMCMEFWDGWFNRWKEPVIKRDPEELAEAVKEAMDLGSINLYMFHGGTNFGFMNGCSARGRRDLHQVTSYDYDALLNEQGNPTEKYFAVKRMLSKHYPELEQKEPLYKTNVAKTQAELQDKVSLFATLDRVSKPVHAKYPVSMEALGETLGYALYRTHTEKDAEEERFRIIDANDRAHFFVDEVLRSVQYQEEIGEDIFVPMEEGVHQIDVLVENMGRVNYGHKFLADTQRKGIRTGVTADLHFLLDWEMYSLPLTNISKVDYSKPWKEGVPAFYRYTVHLETVGDAFADMSGFGKGVLFVNGVNMGRFWEVGPCMTLFISSGFLREGENEFVVFETEGRYQEQIPLVNTPVFIELGTQEEKN